MGYTFSLRRTRRLSTATLWSCPPFVRPSRSMKTELARTAYLPRVDALAQVNRASSVVATTERTFVVRNQNGHAEWVDVRKGAGEGDLLEVLGDLRAGDMVVR